MSQDVVGTGTEKVEAPPATATKPSEFSDLHEAVAQFTLDQAKAAEPPVEVEEKGATKEETAPLGKEEEPCEGCAKDKKAKEEAASKVPFSIVDEKGNKVPLVIRADGKEFVPDTVEKFMTWASLGIHANARLEELNKAEGMLREITDAIVSGQIEVRGGKLIAKTRRQETVSEEEPPGKPEDEDVYLSPEAKEIKRLTTKIEKLEKDHQSLSMTYMDKFVKDQKDILDKDIESHRSKYPLARDKDIWGLLAEVENNQPKYDPETAMKFLHEQELERLKSFTKEHPDIVDKKEIISEYLKDKSKREEAPVQGPSDKTTPSPPAKPKREYKDLHEAMQAWEEDQKSALQAKNKF